MYVKQISVFIENTPGRLAHFTKLLGDNNIDLVSLSVADTTHFGILRGIVADYEKAVKLISDNGYTVKLTDVLAVSVPDHPGGLAEVLETLSGPRHRGGVPLQLRAQRGRPCAHHFPCG